MPPVQRKTKQATFVANQANIEIAKKLDDRLILCIDPGMLTGLCTMTRVGMVREAANLNMDEIYDKLNDSFADIIQLVVMEDYIVGIRAAKLKGSKNEASQIIGIVNAWARRHSIPVVMQVPGILVIAEKLSGKKPFGRHKDMHWMDAFNHGWYFLHSVGLVQIRKRSNA